MTVLFLVSFPNCKLCTIELHSIKGISSYQTKEKKIQFKMLKIGNFAAKKIDFPLDSEVVSTLFRKPW